jgi:hypothetical protein
MPRVQAEPFEKMLGLGSESDRAKKTVEEIELQYFIAAYSGATKEGLSVIEPSERPDFVCSRSDGTRVGVELVRFVGQPLFDALSIFETIWKKEAKRDGSGWRLEENTILVVQLMDYPLKSLKIHFDRTPLTGHGFKEIWLADYSGIEAYGNIELFGLHPLDWWGYYPQERDKPYG